MTPEQLAEMVDAFSTISEAHYGLRREPSMTRRLESAFATLGRHLKDLEDEHRTHPDAASQPAPDGSPGAE